MESSATDPGWIDEAIAGIGADDVYVSPDVRGAGDLEAALSQVVPGDGSVAVVVLPADAAQLEQYDLYILQKLTGAAPQDAVVLAIGDDLMADSAAIGDKALEIANVAETDAGGDLQQGLTLAVERIAAETPDAPAGGAEAGAGILFPMVIGGVVLVAAAITAGALLARRGRRAPAASTDPVPVGIRLRVDRLRELQGVYASLPGNPVAVETAAGIDALASHVEQLFVRLDAKAGEDQSVLAEAEYSDKLARLVAALERDYLYDLLTRPDLWDDPAARIGEVREALSAVTTQIVDNIKQVNARKGLLFQVSLDSLIGRSELRDWERQFSEGAGE